MYQSIKALVLSILFSVTSLFSLSLGTLISVSASASVDNLVGASSADASSVDVSSVNFATAIPAPVELQGYGAFSQLNKDWMIMALYTAVDSNNTNKEIPEIDRLEVKISSKKFSNRRFRALWLEAISIEHGAERIALLEQDLEHFFNMLKGPLIKGDTLVIERTVGGTALSINYHQLALVSEDFLPMIVQSLVGKHPPTQALKSGLLGESSVRDQMNLSIRFERLEPTLPRISEVSKWGNRIIASK